MAATYLKEVHAGRGKSAWGTLARMAGYYENPDKTGDRRYVSSHQCSPASVADEFMLSRQIYKNKTGRALSPAHDVIAYKVRQAFLPGEITPEKANEIGYRLAMDLTGGQCQFMVYTHVDRHHVHNHILINSVRLDCKSKFRNIHNSSREVSRISDRLCRENGLSIIANPKEKGKSHAEWQAAKSGKSWKEKLRADINAMLPGCGSLEALLSGMREAGYEVKPGKHIAFRMAGQQRFTRAGTLGADYTEEALRQRISGAGTPRKSGRTPGSFSLLIDLENSIQLRKGKGFERWATIYNLKEASRTLNYLTEHGLDSYEALEAHEKALALRTSNLLAELRRKETRMKELSVLRGHIIQYARTRDVYTAYRKARFSGAFRAEHAQDLARYQEAVHAFEACEGGRLPKMQAVKEEYLKLKAEKESLYAAYAPLKQERRDLRIIRKNVDALLGRAPARDRKKDMER